MRTQYRFLPLIGLSIAALLTAMWAGLVRIGWTLPAPVSLAQAHGPLMVSGFLGVLIPLERAVAIRQKWMYLVPVLAGFGWISLLIQPQVGSVLILTASIGALGILAVMIKREPKIHMLIQGAGVLSWVIGNALWFSGLPIFQIVFWWMAFLILTIGGERLELGRVLNLPTSQIRLVSLLALLLIGGAATAQMNLNIGSRIFGLGMIGLAGWFLKNDLARRNIRHKNPLTRYIAYCLYGGFIWLGISGSIFVYYGALYAGPIYDAALHMLFVGFVITMIFGHAPIIFPAILGVQIKYYQVFYVHVILLHISLLIRILGDFFSQLNWRRWGGLLNETAIILFVAVTIYSLVSWRKT